MVALTYSGSTSSASGLLTVNVSIRALRTPSRVTPPASPPEKFTSVTAELVSEPRFARVAPVRLTTLTEPARCVAVVEMNSPSFATSRREPSGVKDTESGW